MSRSSISFKRQPNSMTIIIGVLKYYDDDDDDDDVGGGGGGCDGDGGDYEIFVN